MWFKCSKVIPARPASCVWVSPFFFVAAGLVRQELDERPRHLWARITPCKHSIQWQRQQHIDHCDRKYELDFILRRVSGASRPVAAAESHGSGGRGGPRMPPLATMPEVEGRCCIAAGRRAAVVAIVMALVGVSVACRVWVPSPATARAADWNLLLVTLDTLRADRFGCYGRANAETPALDGLAARGVRFDQAQSAVPL